MLPLAVVGFSFASSGILEFFKKYILQTIIVCTNIIYFLLFYNIFSKIEGYEFGGIQMFFVSICIFIIFAILPPEKMKNTILLKILKQITNYTAGIYFIHMSIRNYLQPYIRYVKNKTMKGCIIVYLISYFICFFGNLIFGKTRWNKKQTAGPPMRKKDRLQDGKWLRSLFWASSFWPVCWRLVISGQRRFAGRTSAGKP